MDPVSLAAISAFMQPSDTSAEGAGLRDGLSALLTSVPCARLQTAFDPATGALELRGHIPDPALRADLVARLSAQIGSAIPVSDRMQILPPPQCGTLAAMDAVGLPQSTEQETNPRIVGPDTQIRDYRFLAGQRLELDLTAPDYPAYVYADYFDAEGNVIHLQPNEIVPLAAVAPAEPLSIGRASPGRPALEITIAPPFGQEIAVAFAASRPVFDGPRPMVEPAAPYLDSLRDAIAAARRDDPDFKGEWVYFFVSTAAD